MIGLIQRAARAHVEVDGAIVGQIERGILLLLGVEKEDTQTQADKLLHKVLNYRIFPDESGRMNLSLKDINGGLLIVPQFTLPADTHKGMRPSFTPAAPPEKGEMLFNYFYNTALQQFNNIQKGIFSADMQVSLINDGPVTFWLKI